MSASEYGAAAAYAPTSESDHSRVANVFSPVGRSINVAGSSFITVRSTSNAPAAIPGDASRKVTRTKVCAGE